MVHTTEVTAGEGRGGCVCGGGGEKVGWEVCVRRGRSVCEVEGWEVCVRGEVGVCVYVCVCAGRDERLCKELWENVCARGRGVCEGGKKRVCEREKGAKVCVG